MTDLPIRHDRYPGARPFTDNPEDRRLFFGRADEVETLYHQVLSVRLLVLFGKSGLGKTSLLQAGVMPRLTERDLLPLSVRLNRTDVDPVELVIEAVEEGCKAQGIDYTAGERTSLWEFFKTAMFWRGDALQTPVLVMDQFEEIFTLQSIENRRLLAEQLGELVGAGLPATVRARRKAGEKLPYSERPPALKIILSLREEYFGALQELTREVPKILETRFRIIPLHQEQAKRAVVEPARLADGNTFSTRPFQYADKAVQTMMDFLEAEAGKIESFQLQILCRHVEEQVKRKQAAGATEVTVDPTYLGERKAMDAILQNFYLDTIKTLPARRDRRRARRLCEVGLLNAAGRRKSLDEEDVVRDYKVRPPILARLEDRRLLRKEPRLGAFYYELSHDSLAQPVMNSRRWRLPKRVFIPLVVFVLIATGVTLWQIRQAESARAEAKKAKCLGTLRYARQRLGMGGG